MSLSTFTSGNDGTRPIEAGDTPDIQDDYAVSVPMNNENIAKGDITQMKAGFLQEALAADTAFPLSPAVATESKDNSAGAPGDLQIRVITAGQMIALLASSDPFTVGQYAIIGADGIIENLVETIPNTTQRKYARYVGKEGAIFVRDGNPPFTETLSVGIVPDQNLAIGEVGWFELVESAF